MRKYDIVKLRASRIYKMKEEKRKKYLRIFLICLTKKGDIVLFYVPFYYILPVKYRE